MAAPPQADGRFPTTEWTLIARLQDDDAAVSARALNELCAQYHFPLYCFIRRRGLNHHDAEDALHDFLAKLLKADAFDELAAEKGRLRTYLVKGLQRFLITRHHREQKRTRLALPLFSLDANLEQRYDRDALGPDEASDLIFDRLWCAELLARVLQRLETDCAAKGRAGVFAALRPVLVSGGSLRGHDSEALAASVGLSSIALRTSLLRLLRDYRALLREEVRQTVQSKDEVEAEIAHLMSVVSREARG